MRLAVCLSGQLRGDDDALQRLSGQLLRLADEAGIQSTVICSVWDRYGGKVDGSINTDHLPRLFEPAVCDALPFNWLRGPGLWARLPRLHAERRAMFDSATPEDVLEQRIRQHFPQAVVDVEAADRLALEFDTPKEDRNSLRMLYKIWRANELKRRLERQAGRPFDLVLRMRPDLHLRALDAAVLHDAAERGVLLVNAFMPGGRFVGDSLAIGRSPALDRYAALFGRAVADPAGWDFIHHELHDHLQREGIAYEAYPHTGELSVDRVLPAQAVRRNLQAMQAAGDPAWGPAHALTDGVLAAVTALQAGNAAAAREQLQALAPAAQWPAEALDGWLMQRAATARLLGQGAVALACGLLAWRLRRVDVLQLPAAPFEPIALGLAELPAEIEGQGDRLWSALEDAEVRPWLAAAAGVLVPGFPAEAVLGVLADALWRSPRACRRVLNHLIEQDRLPDLLIRPALFSFEGALQDRDVVRLHAQLRAAVGDAQAARALMRAWARLDPTAAEPQAWLLAHPEPAAASAVGIEPAPEQERAHPSAAG